MKKIDYYITNKDVYIKVWCFETIAILKNELNI